MRLLRSLPPVVFSVLLIATILWAGFYGKAVWDHREAVYSLGMSHASLNVAIFSGLVLFGGWTAAGIKERNLWVSCAAIGMLLMFGWLAAANTRDLGYTSELLLSGEGGAPYLVRLNPLFHLGGGTSVVSYYGVIGVTLPSSMAVENQLWYLALGEVIPFSIAGIYLSARRLKLK
jgi:hypothetical protein